MSAPIRSSNHQTDRPAAGRRRFLIALGLGLGLLVGGTMVGGFASTAAADGVLDGARAAGVVGERFDGYAVIRDSNASADVRDLVDSVNAQRRQLYENRAASEGVPVDQVGRVYARQILEAAPSGTWFQLENGSWVQN